jgi:antitoxin Phd
MTRLNPRFLELLGPARQSHKRVKGVEFMETQVTIAEAKNRLPSIIHSVEKGSPVKLTRHGRSVAVLLSIRQYERLSREKEGYWDALQSLRNLLEGEDVQISDADFEGLRDHPRGRDVELM